MYRHGYWTQSAPRSGVEDLHAGYKLTLTITIMMYSTGLVYLAKLHFFVTGQAIPAEKRQVLKSSDLIRANLTLPCLGWSQFYASVRSE
jgi:hypothetical protein